MSGGLADAVREQYDALDRVAAALRPHRDRAYDWLQDDPAAFAALANAVGDVCSAQRTLLGLLDHLALGGGPV